jgi:hypothetical protein
MSRPALVLFTACMTGLLGGCGEKMGERVLGAATTVSEVIGSGAATNDFDATRTYGAAFTPDAVAASPDDYLLVTINALGITELSNRIAGNDSNSTWISQSGFSISYRDGILVATRGLVGEDVMAASTPGLPGVLRAGGGTVNRAMETLDSLNQIQTMTFTCTVTPNGTETISLGVRDVSARRFDENCRGDAVIFDNIYWLDEGGDIVASRQYVSPTVAYLRCNRL